MGNFFHKTTEEVKHRLQQLQVEERLLQDALVMRATLQGYTETHYNLLVDLAYEGMTFLGTLQEGDRVDSDWIDRRDELLARAQFLIDDAPIIAQRPYQERI